MKRIRLLLSFAVILFMMVMVSRAAAQSSYSFSLEQETVNAYWNSDGTLAVDYLFAFSNDQGAAPIDYVDVGMPNDSFDPNSITADINGTSVPVSSSDYEGQGSGFSVVLGSEAIQPGNTGQVDVSVPSLSGLLYQDTQQPSTYASAEFSPTWFDSSDVHGNTDLSVIFHLPPGVQPSEPSYHSTQGGWPCGDTPTVGTDQQNRITYTWSCSSASPSTQYTFGASFPQSDVAAGTVAAAPSAVGNFFSGLSSFAPIAGILLCFGLVFIGIPLLTVINQRRRKLDYLPPKISIEGHGIKRGLTAVEAGILLEEPLDKIMTMILFGVVKKNATKVVTRDPLQLEILSPQPADLHDYEKDFLAAFAVADPAARRKALQDMSIRLVSSVSEKMKGFSRKETAEYYKSIMERAWQQIEAAGTPEVKSQLYNEALEWTMLDKNYEQRTSTVFVGPIFLPIWWGNFDPGYRPAPAVAGAPHAVPAASGGRSAASIPGAAFAASVVTGVKGFSSHVLGNLGSFTSGVTTRTNPAPLASSAARGHWSGGGVGGGHCACACACAGCACACAGGGR